MQLQMGNLNFPRHEVRAKQVWLKTCQTNQEVVHTAFISDLIYIVINVEYPQTSPDC